MNPQPNDDHTGESAIKRLYLAAKRLPPDERPAFLAEACAGNEELQREVEELLNYDATGDGFLAQPAAELFAAELADEQANELIGRQLGHYLIEAEIGRGGMGEVYRAVDQRLGRAVAIKVLPAEFTLDASVCAASSARRGPSRRSSIPTSSRSSSCSATRGGS